MSRTPVALAAGLAGFAAYLAIAVVLADRIIGLGWAAEAAYYLAAGLLWIVPAYFLMRWAARSGPST
jgi:hypothetical protein